MTSRSRQGFWTPQDAFIPFHRVNLMRIVAAMTREAFDEAVREAKRFLEQVKCVEKADG